MFKGIGDLAGMLKQAQSMGSRMKEMNEQLSAIRAIGSAGGGLVEVEVNGLGEMMRISIDSTLLEKKDRELIEDLVPAATNAALSKAKEQQARSMQDLAGGMDIPGLSDALQTLGDGTSNSPPSSGS
ncbi:MAG: YbaB/EbfC family nucleoid-associated protein [Pirellulales bacterium]|nr:YbaB/EbfC family nucleoid-associated protein [Pirellulales bacterium]